MLRHASIVLAMVILPAAEPSAPRQQSGQPGNGPEVVQASFVRDGVGLAWGSNFESLDSRARADLDKLEWGPSDAFDLGRPSSLYKRLLAKSDPSGEWWPVNWPGDLEGHVQIRTPDESLEFVRVFSSVDTWYRFEHYGYVEVTPSETLAYNRSGAARMSAEEYARLKLPMVSVDREQDGFRLVRPVLKMSMGRPVAVAVLNEVVTANGKYVVRVLWSRKIETLANHVQALRPRE